MNSPSPAADHTIRDTGHLRSSTVPDPPLSSIQQRAGLYLERLGELLDNHDGGIARAAFEVADVGAVDLRLEGELLLRQALLLSQGSQVLSKALANVHDAIVRGMSLIGLQTIRDIALDFTNHQSVAARH
jgi:hypothetical protein